MTIEEIREMTIKLKRFWEEIDNPIMEDCIVKAATNLYLISYLLGDSSVPIQFVNNLRTIDLLEKVRELSCQQTPGQSSKVH